MIISDSGLLTLHSGCRTASAARSYLRSTSRRRAALGVSQVQGGVPVPVKHHSTGMTDERPLRQVHVGPHHSALRTGLRAGKPAVHLLEGDSKPIAPILQLGDEASQRSIGQGPGQTAVLHHPGYVQGLYHHLADGLRRYSGCGLVMGVVPDVPYPGVCRLSPAVLALSPVAVPGLAVDAPRPDNGLVQQPGGFAILTNLGSIILEHHRLSEVSRLS